MDNKSDNSLRYLPVELRLLEQGGDDSRSLYRLRSGDIEFVWSDQESDVLLCEAQGREIIDGLEAQEMRTLAMLLDYESCITYDPRSCYVNDEGMLMQLDAPQDNDPRSAA